MKLQDMFVKKIDRPINGVIKVMQTDEQNRREELEEYVITRELQKHFGAFYDRYEQGIEGNTDQMGVWISGFFGSGKSHFIKINRHSPYLSITLHKCSHYYLLSICAFLNSAYLSTTRHKFSTTIV